MVEGGGSNTQGISGCGLVVWGFGMLCCGRVGGRGTSLQCLEIRIQGSGSRVDAGCRFEGSRDRV